MLLRRRPRRCDHWQGADLLLLDDELKDSEEARYENIRRSMHDWFQHDAYTRLAPGGALVLIQTRWHADDLPGRLLREHANEGWVVINMPAIAEVDEDFRKEEAEELDAEIVKGFWNVAAHDRTCDCLR